MNGGKTLAALIVAGALMTQSAPLMATWNYSQWGMSVDEAIAASGGTLTKVKDKKGQRILDQRLLATGRTIQDGMEFELSLYFAPKTEKLTKLSLTPKMGDCIAFRDRQLEVLGTAELDRNSQQLLPNRPPLVHDKYKWQDLSGSGTITFLMVAFGTDPQYCKLLYEK